MATVNPAGLYTGGAVRLNSAPEANIYAQLLARKQAKDDAIDEYYRKLPSTVNSAGMRDQDRQGLDQAVGDWQKHWLQNKDKIRNGKTKEAFDSEQMFRQIQNKVQESKDAAKTDLELGKMRFSKDNGYIFDDPDFVNAQHQHALSVWDAGHKALDLGTIAVPPKPMDTEAQKKYWNSITNGIKPTGKEYDESKQTSNPVTGLVAVPYVKKYKPEQIIGIAENAGNVAATDKNVRAYYNNVLYGKDQATINKLQQAYSSVYKDDIIDSPEKAAKADAILRASVPQEQGEDFRRDEKLSNERTLGRQQVMEAIRQGNRKEMAGIRRGWQVLDQQTQNGILEEVVSGYVKDPKTIPESILNSYKKKDGDGHTVDFNQIKVSPDGTKVELNYVDAKGKKIDAFSADANLSDIKERTRKQIETAQTNVVNTGTNKGTPKKKVYNPKTGKFE